MIEIAAGAFNDSNVTEIEISNRTTVLSVKLQPIASLAEVIIPTSVREIGDSVFMHCFNLASVTFEGGYDALVAIGSSVFYGCSSLTEVHLPESVISMGVNVFYNCANLETVTLPSEIGIIPERTFAEDVSLTSICIPSSVKIIGASAFYNCKSLENVTFDQGSDLTTIAENAFFSTGISKFIVSSDVTSIGSKAFFGCAKLKTVVNLSSLTIRMGDGVENHGRIDEHADIITKTDVMPVDYDTYTGDDGVVYTYAKYIPFSGNNIIVSTEYGAGYVSFSANNQNPLKVLISVDNKDAFTYQIDDDIDAIGYDVFKRTENHENGIGFITIPENVISIANYSFHGCYGLHVVANLSDMNISNISHTSNYGYISYYLGECYNEEISVDPIESNGVKYYQVVNSQGTLLDTIAYGYTDTLGEDAKLLPATTVIAYKAFEKANIKTITIPVNVRKIQYKAFDACAELTVITFANASGWYNASNETLITNVADYLINNSSLIIYRKD